MAQTVKNLPTMQETWVQSLGQKDTLEKGMATNASILAWRIPWIESLVGYGPWGRKESDTTAQLSIAYYKINFHKQILRPEIMLIIHLAEQEEVLRKRN